MVDERCSEGLLTILSTEGLGRLLGWTLKTRLWPPWPRGSVRSSSRSSSSVVNEGMPEGVGRVSIAPTILLVLRARRLEW